MRKRAYETRATREPPVTADPRDSDPLAELARLVGQDDPFRDIFGDARRAAGEPAPEPEGPRDFGLDLEHALLRQGYPTDAQAHTMPAPEAGYAYADSDYQDGYDYEEDAAPVKRRRGGLVTAAAVVGIVALGGVGVLAYTGGVSVPGTRSGPPPVIKAEPGPSKTVPETAEAELPSHNKLIYDRVGSVDPKKPERVVPRAEEPVELPPAPQRTASVAGRDVAGSGAAPLFQVPQDGQPNSEPRRVRTVLIRPDGSVQDTPASTRGLPPLAPEAARPQPGPTTTASVDSTAAFPLPSAPAPEPVPQSAEPALADVPLPPQRPAPPSTTLVRQARPPETPAAAAPAQPTRLAALPAQQSATDAAPAVRTAPTAAPSAGGRFVVQLTSQRTEQDARQAYAGLQQRFSGLLAGQQPSIQKADLGGRGTFYRVRVGPMSSREDAVRFCASLKSQGGECVVVPN